MEKTTPHKLHVFAYGEPGVPLQPGGGFNDYKGSFDEMADAEAFVRELLTMFTCVEIVAVEYGTGRLVLIKSY